MGIVRNLCVLCASTFVESLDPSEMPGTASKAFGKIILFGEHAVVYGQPAIAIPVTEVQANVTVRALPGRNGNEIHIVARDIGIDGWWKELPSNSPLAATFALIKNHFKLDHLPAMEVNISSTIPLAAGMGSGAAITTAVFRAVTSFLGLKLDNTQLSGLVFEIERLYHGHPSGIDNTVIAQERPVYFIKGHPFKLISVGRQMIFLIAVSSKASRTIEVVEEVKNHLQRSPERIRSILESIGEITRHAKDLLSEGDTEGLGRLMDQNQVLLQELGVSSNELDDLITAARMSGAKGAKLSGAGKGGNIIALCDEPHERKIRAALADAGAVSVIKTILKVCA